MPGLALFTGTYPPDALTFADVVADKACSGCAPNIERGARAEARAFKVIKRESFVAPATRLNLNGYVIERSELAQDVRGSAALILRHAGLAERSPM